MSFLLKRLSEFSSLIEKTVFSTKKKDILFWQAQEKIHGILSESIRLKRKIFVVGNGGSSGIASHHVVDLVNVVKAPAFALSDSNLITCMGNDYGYPLIFSKPLENLAHQGDILIAISSSGQSQNILEACKVMKQKSGVVVTLSGFKEDNPLRSAGDLNIWTGIDDYGLVESAHFFILHTFIDAWAQKITMQQSQTAEVSQG
ncbi:MAG: Phosphoheptose isomerase [Chlamydiae bacterium]|nr:Phosphoheptose isomerase [Chlamydiota bacterium]